MARSGTSVCDAQYRVTLRTWPRGCDCWRRWMGYGAIAVHNVTCRCYALSPLSLLVMRGRCGYCVCMMAGPGSHVELPAAYVTCDPVSLLRGRCASDRGDSTPPAVCGPGPCAAAGIAARRGSPGSALTGQGWSSLRNLSNVRPLRVGGNRPA